MITEAEKKRKGEGRGFIDSGFASSTPDLSGSRVRCFEVSAEKRAVRSRLLQMRLCLSSQEADKLSRQVIKNLLALKCFRDAETIALYFPIRNEVRTEGIFERAKEFGKEVYFPRIEGSLLKFLRVNDLGDLRPGKFGIPEPHRESGEIGISDLDLVIIPGIAFDPSGGRLGYGKGYYDRAVLEVIGERRVGLAYSFQILDRIPAEVGDERVGLVVMESGVIFCEGG